MLSFFSIWELFFFFFYTTTTQTNERKKEKHQGSVEGHLHVWTKFIEVSVAILFHFLWAVDGQRPVGVHGYDHTANVSLRGRNE